METQTLFRGLLHLVEEPEYEVAKALQISPASLSRHAQGLLRKPSVLRRAAEYFTKAVGGKIPVDADLLMHPITGAGLVALCDWTRRDSLQKGVA